MIRKHIFKILFLCFSAALLPAAETPRAGEFPFQFGPLGLTTLMQEVGLSETQMRQFQEIYQSQRHQLVDLRAEVEKKEGDLQQVLDTPQVDLGQAERAVDALLEARGRLAKATTMMMVRMRQAVSQEQWRKMAELQRRLPAPPLPPAPVAAPAPPGAPSPAFTPKPGRAPAPAPPPPPPEI